MLRVPEFSSEPPRLPFSGESRYLTPLQVSGNGDRSDPLVTDSELGADPNHQKIQDLEPRPDKIDPNHQKIQDKITSALKLLTFREERVLVQFWCPYVVGKHQILTTRNQPFGVGVNDTGLRSYRQDSVVNMDEEEPVSRVFRQGLPEWTSDLNNYTRKHFPQQERAIGCNLHGYLAVPVFDSKTQLSVGVLELLTSLKHTSYAYEVQQIHDALETVDLRTQQAFDWPTINVPNERRLRDLDKINAILKTMCAIHALPLAQTWAVSQHASFVSHEKVIEKSCSSFDIRCVRKVCLSRAALPFHVQNLRMWPFLKACRERHLDRSPGVVGRALLTRGSCFCRDVTKLSEEEYPLVHYARMNGLTSCFAILLHSIEANDDYALEFFLPTDINVQNLVQTLKQNIETASGFELGDSSSIQIVGLPTEVGKSLSIDPHPIQISSITATNNNKFEMATSDAESVGVNIANKTKTSVNVPNQSSSKQIYPDNFSDIITDTKHLTGDDFTRHDFNVVSERKNNMISYPSVSMQKKSNSSTDAGEKSNRLKQGRKRKIDNLTMEAVEKHFGRPIDQAAKSLGVSRSRLEQFRREHDLTIWTFPEHRKKTAHITNLKLLQKSWSKQNLQRPSHICFGLWFAVFLMVRVKRWSCSSKSHGFSGKWWSCGRHRYLPSKSDAIYQAAHLFVLLRRWRNKNSMRNSLHNSDHPAVKESKAKPKYRSNIINTYSRTAESSHVLASPKQVVTNISDTKMVTVKATFKEDMIKFQFPTSSGLLELEHEVAQRIKIKSRRLHLKYMDEDDDLILLACDADLHNLLRFTANGSIIKIIIQMADY